MDKSEKLKIKPCVFLQKNQDCTRTKVDYIILEQKLNSQFYLFKIVNLSIYRNYISFVLLIVVYNITYNLMFGTELHKNVMLQSNCTEVYCSLELLWNTIFTHSFLIEHLVYKLLTMIIRFSINFTIPVLLENVLK